MIFQFPLRRLERNMKPVENRIFEVGGGVNGSTGIETQNQDIDISQDILDVIAKNESNNNPGIINKNDNGQWSCGLYQISQKYQLQAYYKELKSLNTQKVNDLLTPALHEKLSKLNINSNNTNPNYLTSVEADLQKLFQETAQEQSNYMKPNFAKKLKEIQSKMHRSDQNFIHEPQAQAMILDVVNQCGTGGTKRILTTMSAPSSNAYDFAQTLGNKCKTYLSTKSYTPPLTMSNVLAGRERRNQAILRQFGSPPSTESLQSTNIHFDATAYAQLSENSQELNDTIESTHSLIHISRVVPNDFSTFDKAKRKAYLKSTFREAYKIKTAIENTESTNFKTSWEKEINTIDSAGRSWEHLSKNERMQSVKTLLENKSPLTSAEQATLNWIERREGEQPFSETTLNRIFVTQKRQEALNRINTLLSSQDPQMNTITSLSQLDSLRSAMNVPTTVQKQLLKDDTELSRESLFMMNSFQESRISADGLRDQFELIPEYSFNRRISDFPDWMQIGGLATVVFGIYKWMTTDSAIFKTMGGLAGGSALLALFASGETQPNKIAEYIFNKTPLNRIFNSSSELLTQSGEIGPRMTALLGAESQEYFTDRKDIMAMNIVRDKSKQEIMSDINIDTIESMARHNRTTPNSTFQRAKSRLSVEEISGLNNEGVTEGDYYDGIIRTLKQLGKIQRGRLNSSTESDLVLGYQYLQTLYASNWGEVIAIANGAEARISRWDYISSIYPASFMSMLGNTFTGSQAHMEGRTVSRSILPGLEEIDEDVLFADMPRIDSPTAWSSNNITTSFQNRDTYAEKIKNSKTIAIKTPGDLFIIKNTDDLPNSTLYIANIIQNYPNAQDNFKRIQDWKDNAELKESILIYGYSKIGPNMRILYEKFPNDINTINGFSRTFASKIKTKQNLSTSEMNTYLDSINTKLTSYITNNTPPPYVI